MVCIRVQKTLRICHGCSICKNHDELITPTVRVMVSAFYYSFLIRRTSILMGGQPELISCQSSFTVKGNVSCCKSRSEFFGIESNRYRTLSILIIYPPQQPHIVPSTPVIVPTDLKLSLSLLHDARATNVNKISSLEFFMSIE